MCLRQANPLSGWFANVEFQTGLWILSSPPCPDYIWDPPRFLSCRCWQFSSLIKWLEHKPDHSCLCKADIRLHGAWLLCFLWFFMAWCVCRGTTLCFVMFCLCSIHRWRVGCIAGSHWYAACSGVISHWNQFKDKRRSQILQGCWTAIWRFET